VDAGSGFDGGVVIVDAGGSGDAGTPAPWPDPGTMSSPARLYTADGQSFEIDRVGAAVTHTLPATGAAHLIVYLHGRSCGGGGEPTKSLGDAVPELEANYRAKVVMFSWPGSSSGCPIGFPETEARASGTAFAHTVHKLAAFLSTNPRPGLTLTLIPHSMGNLVVEEALVRGTSPWPPRLFSTVIVQSSASAATGHATWLARGGFSAATYVTVNDSDSVLTAAGVGRSTRLGKSLAGVTLTSTARYVDFSAANVNHAYYLHSGQKGVGMREFYDSVMRGQPFNFAGSSRISRVEQRNGANVYIFNGT